MKITFKDYDTLVTLAKEEGYNVDRDFDWFLKEIAGKTFACSDYKVSGGGKIQEFFSIETSAVAQDGGFNTNVVFGDFSVPKTWLENVDYEGKTYWACINCGMIITPDQKYPFDIKKTYGDLGVENCVCPGCFTKTFKVVNS